MFSICYVILVFFLCAIIVSSERVSLLSRLPRSLVKVTIDLETNSVAQQSNIFGGFSEELVVHIAHDTNASTVFFAFRNNLRSASLTGPPNVKEIAKIGGVLDETITTLAYDWVNKLVYVGIANIGPDTSARIEVCPIGGSRKRCSVILHNGVEFLQYLVLDPIDGYMYWLNGVRQQVERAFMNGEHHDRHPFQHPISSSSLPPLSSLTLHHQSRTLYYVRSPSDMSEVWRCELYKRDSCTRIAQSHRIMYFTVTMNHFLWTTIGDQLFSCKLNRCEETKKILQGLSGAEIIQPIGTDVQPHRTQPNPCLTENGGCSDYCLLVHFEPWAKCTCEMGVKMWDDNRTCDPRGVDQVLFVAAMSGLFFVSLDTTDRTPQHVPYEGYETESPTHKLFDVDWDPIEQKVYWIDATARKIRRCGFNGSDVQDVVSYDVSSTAKSLRIDPYSRTVYWLDEELSRIQVSRMDGKARRTLLFGGIEKPQGLAIDPLSGYLYFTDWAEKQSRIERVRLDGTERITFLRLEDHSWPNGLDIDTKEGKLYWTESNRSQIKSAKTDSSAVEVLSKANGRLMDPYAITKLGTKIYSNSMVGRSLMEVEINTETPFGHNTPVLSDLGIYGPLGIRAVSLHTKLNDQSPCLTDNGGCSDICVTTPEKQSKCLCSTGLELQENGKKCEQPNAYLMMAMEDSFFRLSMRKEVPGREVFGIPKSGRPFRNMEVDQSSGMLYVGGGNDKTGYLSRIRLNGSRSEEILSGISMAGLSGIVVDQETKNIYWSSLQLARIEVCDSSGRYRRTIAWKDIRPSLLTASHQTRELFYYNEAGNKSIMKMSFFGNSRGGQAIVTSLHGTVHGLSIDARTSQLYWTEHKGNIARLSVSRLDGSRKEVLFLGDGRRPSKIFHHSFKLWAIDELTSELGYYEKKEFNIVHSNVENIIGLIIVHGAKTTANGDKVCSFNNGGCTHICLQGMGNATCVCSDHYITEGVRNCTPSDRLVYIGASDRVVRMKLTVSQGRTVEWDQDPSVIVPVTNVGNPRSIAFDPLSRNRYLYWIDSKTPKVLKIAPDAAGGQTSQLSLSRYNCSHLYSLALDDLGRQLFVSCTDKGNVSSILVFRIQDVESPTQNGFLHFIGRVISGDSVSSLTGKPSHPKNIAVFPTSGILFYVDVANGHHVSIITCSIDGKGCQIWLSGKDLTSDTVLHADPQFLRLVFTSTTGVWTGDVVPSANIRQYFARSPSESTNLPLLNAAPYDEEGLIVSENDLIFDTTRKNPLQLPLFSTVTAVYSVVRGAERLSLDACSRSQCSHLCRFERNFESTANYKCLCPIGFMPNKRNPKTCEARKKCHQWQFACDDGRHCVHSSSKCDQIRDCPDGSDELSSMCRQISTDRWPCDSGRGSVPRNMLCNGHEDCSDGSDERHCRCTNPTLEVDCSAWPIYGNNTQCLGRRRVCSTFEECQRTVHEEHSVCSQLAQPTTSVHGNPEMFFLALFVVLILLLAFILCCFCRKKTTLRVPTADQAMYRLNGGTEASILLPTSADRATHVELALRTYSVVDSSSSYPVLPTPNRNYASSGMSSSYGRRIDEIPINQFYAPPPSAASLSTYGVVKPAGIRPLDTSTATRRKRRTKGESRESRERDRTPPPIYSQVDSNSIIVSQPILVDSFGSVQGYGQQRQPGIPGPTRTYVSHSPSPRHIRRPVRGELLVPSNSRIVSSESSSTPSAKYKYTKTPSSSSLSSEED